MTGITVPIADPKYALRKTAPTEEENKRPLEVSEQAEKDLIDKIITKRDQYQQNRKGKEREWTESYKMYMSWIDTTLNPYLSNLFIPKTHEAVELLSAFLIGTAQSVSATGESGGGDIGQKKGLVASKWMDFLWRKKLDARFKTLVWMKGGVVFGNAVMKVGYDTVAKKPWMSNCAIEDVYFDYFEPNIQDSEYLFHEVRRELSSVQNDEKYDLTDKDGKLLREQVIVGGDKFSQATALFNTFDRSFSQAENKGKVLIMETWCLEGDGSQTLISLLPTSLGWRIGRKTKNPNKYKDGTLFRPFVKLRFKTSPVPNRAYDMGAVFPTIKIQKAFNDLVNEYFDNVVLVNNSMWLKRRGARVNPMELVRRPGGVVTVGNIETDLKQEQTADVKASIVEMLNRLDNEFQQASMVINLLKGITGGGTATGDALGQQNSQMLLDMIDGNIISALSEIGQMILTLSLSNDDGVQQITLYETDLETGTLEFKPSDIDGMHDVKIVPDRSTNESKQVLAKQMIDLLNTVAPLQALNQKYPTMMEKIIKRWLDIQGIPDPDYFFEDEAQPTQPAQPGDQVPALPDMGGKTPALPASKDQLSPEAIKSSVLKSAGVIK